MEGWRLSGDNLRKVVEDGRAAPTAVVVRGRILLEVHDGRKLPALATPRGQARGNRRRHSRKDMVPGHRLDLAVEAVRFRLEALGEGHAARRESGHHVRQEGSQGR